MLAGYFAQDYNALQMDTFGTRKKRETLTVTEGAAAQLLRIDIKEVELLVSDGLLKTQNGRVTVTSLNEELRRRWPGFAFSQAKVSRRQFLLAFTLVSGSATIIDFSKKTWDDYQKKRGRIENATEILRSITGATADMRETEVGFPIYGNGHQFHPDNLAARMALSPALGYDLPSPLPLEPSPVEHTGDVLIAGGPVSTRLTQIVFEFEGADNRNLHRRHNASIPLRWWPVANESDPHIDGTRLAYVVEGIGAQVATNWPLFDARKRGDDAFLFSQPGDRYEKGYLPTKDYLTLNKLPNFTSPRLIGLLRARKQRRDWPTLVVVQGLGSLGTRAAELLLTEEGSEQLEEANRRVSGTNFFQLMFEVSRLKLQREHHRFTKIQFIDHHAITCSDRQWGEACSYARQCLLSVPGRVVSDY